MDAFNATCSVSLVSFPAGIRALLYLPKVSTLTNQLALRAD